MTNRQGLAASAAVLLAACSGAHRPSVAPAQDPRHGQLLQLEADMFTALRERNGERLRTLLSPDFELHAPGEVTAGREAFITALHAIPGTVVDVGSDDVEARVLGDVGILSGHQRSRVKLADGSVVTQVGVFNDVARWAGGRWTFVLAYAVNVSETVEPPR